MNRDAWAAVENGRLFYCVADSKEIVVSFEMASAGAYFAKSGRKYHHLSSSEQIAFETIAGPTGVDDIAWDISALIV